jgi:hypothetical protein
MWQNRKKKTTSSSRSKAMQKADKYFSLFIRTRDSQEYGGMACKCISCGKVTPIENIDCGHYINRQHMATRYSELNCNGQCVKCNRFDEGNPQGYRKGLIKKIGEAKVEMLEAAKYTTNHLSEFDLETIAKDYKKRYKQFKYQIR